MKRKTLRKHKQKRQRTCKRKQQTCRYKKQRGGNIMNSVKIPNKAVIANPIEIDGGYKFETP
jgi:hypothetical protein